MKQEIIPAVMPRNIHDIASAALSVRHAAQTVQLDLMDGNYVPVRTWPFTTHGAYDLADAQKGDFGLPHWNEVNYELDLMVARPEESLDDILSLGASRIIFHMASVHNWDPIFNLDSIVRNFIELGIAITIHDDLHELFSLLDTYDIDFVQVMGIGRIGFQGEPFAIESLDVIRDIKARYPDLCISVDGGVNVDTIATLHEVGVERFVAGSAVFAQGLAEENIENLQGYIGE